MSTPDLFNDQLSVVDPEVAEAVNAELRRQQTTLEMIASENFAPQSVLQAQGSVLTNKYAEATRASATTAAASTSTRRAAGHRPSLFGSAANAAHRPANAAAMFALLAGDHHA